MHDVTSEATDSYGGASCLRGAQLALLGVGQGVFYPPARPGREKQPLARHDGVEINGTLVRARPNVVMSRCGWSS